MGATIKLHVSEDSILGVIFQTLLVAASGRRHHESGNQRETKRVPRRAANTAKWWPAKYRHTIYSRLPGDSCTALYCACVYGCTVRVCTAVHFSQRVHTAPPLTYQITRVHNPIEDHLKSAADAGATSAQWPTPLLGFLLSTHYQARLFKWLLHVTRLLTYLLACYLTHVAHHYRIHTVP